MNPMSRADPRCTCGSSSSRWPGGKWQISIGGGTLPIWSRNGRELFFQNLDNRIMVTDYEVKNESFMAVSRACGPTSDSRKSAESELRLGAGQQTVCNIPRAEGAGKRRGASIDVPAKLLRRTPAPRPGDQMIGETVAHYRITAQIGAGGMGEVYRARDTKLKRDVALKVLPEAFAADPERMARFQREAEVLASLNHPNIAEIYGVEDGLW